MEEGPGSFCHTSGSCIRSISHRSREIPGAARYAAASRPGKPGRTGYLRRRNKCLFSKPKEGRYTP